MIYSGWKLCCPIYIYIYIYHYDLSDNLSTNDLRVLLTMKLNTFVIDFNFLNLEIDI